MDSRLASLLRWYRSHQRDLPWRKTRDGYQIFMSELMLQQTQVDRVIPLYKNWLKKFPSWSALAEASTPQLLHAWAGLGYNRRALYAREAARQVVAQGEPKTEEAWRSLKGVGPYMAAALSEFVNHRRAVVIDTNVRRVAGRAFVGLAYPSLTDDKRIIRTLERVTPTSGSHWDVPQAFMDLASSTCHARVPDCANCPLQKVCKARSKFSEKRLEDTLKTKPRKKTTERVHGEKRNPDRIYRGRILAVVRKEERVSLKTVGPRIDETFDPIADTDWLHAMVQRLAKDGLIILRAGDTLCLPHS